MDILVDNKRLKWDFGSLSTVAIVLILFSVEYYCFIVVFLSHLLKLLPSLGGFIFIEIHLLVMLMLWSYFKVITNGPGYLSSRINEGFSNVEELREKQRLLLKYKQNKKKDQREEDIDSHSNDVVQLSDESNRKQNTEDLESDPEHIRIRKMATSPLLQLQELGYCFKCNRVKIPRAHHCKNCKRCVIRMDHHCPWTGNCIGLYNHKFFILFLLYGAIICVQTFLWQACIYLPNAYNYQKGLDPNETLLIQVSMIISGALSISLSFLAIFQAHITSRNVTTVEHHIEGIFEKNPFDKGSSWNIEEIFGVNRATWLLPVKPKLKSEEDLFLLRNY